MGAIHRDSHKTGQPVGSGCEQEVPEVRLFREQPRRHKGARGFPIDGALYVEARAAALLLVSDADLVRARVERDRLAHRARADAEVAPEHERAVHDDVNPVVGAGVHVERLCPGQKPITPPLNAEESPWQRGIVLQKCEADLGGAILKQWIASKANVGMERTGEAGRSHGHPVQESVEGRQRQHDAEIPCQDAPWRDVRPHRAPTISPSTTPHVSMVSARRGPKVFPTRAGPRGSGEVHRPRS